ncbi:MAG: hypothetical protein IKG77_10490 [Prevotella sp.]|nr:hypothetical protein [Prevotella sp.]MBR3068156.1 hypothetical protein [Prevotella sp.]
MAKDEELNKKMEADDAEQQLHAEAGQPDEKQREAELTTLQKMKRQAKEGDEAPTGSLRFRDILGGDYLWSLVRNQIWVIILIVFITTAYVAVRYQCQQDAIDISQLEKNLVDAKFQALSSSSNLTRMCRQSSVQEMLKQNNDSLLHISQQPPYIIEVPEE